MVSFWVPQQDPASKILADVPAPQNQAVQTPIHSDRQTRQRQAPYSHNTPHPPFLPGCQWVRFSCCAFWGADAPAPHWESWASLLSPSLAPLSGIPLPPGCPLSLHLPLAWSAQHHRPVRQHPRSCAVQPSPASAFCPSTPTRSLSAYPSHLDAGLQTAPAAAATAAVSAVAAAAAQEGAREGGRWRVSPPLCLSPPFRSPPLRSTAAHAAAPAPSRPAQGSHACQTRVTQATRGGPLAPAPCSFPRAPPGGIPFPSPGPLPPTVTGVLTETGCWMKWRGLREAGPRRQAGLGGHPYWRKEGKEDETKLGEASGWGFRRRGPA